MSSRYSLAWIVVVIGFIAWGGVYMLWSAVGQTIAQYQQQGFLYTKTANTSDTQSAEHALFVRSNADRTAIHAILQQDPAGVITLIKQTMTTQGVSVSVTNADNGTAASSTVHAVPLIVSVDGSYQQVFRTLRVLERLPLVITIDSVDMSATEDRNTITWHLHTHSTVFIQPSI